MSVALLIGCATTQRRDPAGEPAENAVQPAPAAPSRASVALDPSLAGDQLGSALARKVRRLVPVPAALLWGDASPPPGSRPVVISVGDTKIEGWLIGSAQHVDMGQLAPEIHDVLLLSFEKRHLLGSHPSGPGRIRIDLDGEDEESRRMARDTFAFVSVEPDDVADDATALDLARLLARLPEQFRYIVMPLPS